MIIEKALKILKQPVCDNCLGRQFSQLLSGFTNAQRGRAIRMAVAMSADAGNASIDASSVPGFKLRNRPPVSEAPQCSVCFGLFNELGKYAKKAAARGKKTGRCVSTGTDRQDRGNGDKSLVHLRRISKAQKRHSPDKVAFWQVQDVGRADNRKAVYESNERNRPQISRRGT